MKQKTSVHRSNRQPVWTLNHWLLAIVFAFIVLIILAMVLFLIFPNKAV